MFPAYKQDDDQHAHVSLITKKSEEFQLNKESSAKNSLFPIIEQEKRTELLSSIESESERSEKSTREKKRKKKSKKKKTKKPKKLKKEKKEKKRRASTTETSESDSESKKPPYKIEFVFNDPDYLRAFEGISKEKLNKAHFIEDIPFLTYKHAYRVDKRADKNNLCFDTVYHREVPAYYVPSDGYSASKDSHKKSLRQRRKEQIERAKSSRYFVMGQRVAKDKSEIEEKFNLKSSLAANRSKNLWLYKEMKKIDAEESFQDKTIEFNKYLNENPRDVNKWLEFISYQDTLQTKKMDKNLMATQADVAEEQHQNQTSLYHRKLALFERALKENPANFELTLELIKFKANSSLNELDTFEKIEDEFHKLIMSEQENQLRVSTGRNIQVLFHIWFEYLRFILNRNQTNITANTVRRIFQKCFKYFLNEDFAKKFLLDEKIVFKFYENLFNLVSLYIRFLNSCGFEEKAVGLLQALMEFNLSEIDDKRSKFNNLDTASLKDLFELFYDSNLPKFGEKCSIGWLNEIDKREELFQELEKNVFERDDRRLDELEKDLLDQVVETGARVEHQWVKIENLRALFHWYPFYPQICAGESAEDCADPDRLIQFDEDISFALFKLDSHLKLPASISYFKMKLVATFFENIRILSISNEDNEAKSIESDEGEAKSYFSYLNVLFKFNTETNFDFLSNLYASQDQNLLINFIQFQRDSFDQALKIFANNEAIRTAITIIKWKFELLIYMHRCKREPSQDLKETKEALLNKTKTDLSMPQNRSNVNLWINYAIVKYLLLRFEFHANENKSDAKAKLVALSREMRKVFETLFKTNANNRLNLLKLCSIWFELEFGVHFRAYDCIFADEQFDVGISTIDFCECNVNAFDESSNKKLSPWLYIDRSYLLEAVTQHCLNKLQVDQKQSAKIEISNSLKALIAKKDFSANYEARYLEISTGQHVNNIEKQNEFVYFHKLYSFYLILNADFELFLEINDVEKFNFILSNNKSNSIRAKLSELLKFFILIANMLFTNKKCFKSKNDYKIKLFSVVNYLVKSKYKLLNDTLNRLIQQIFLNLKMNAVSLFCNQLVEANDLDHLINLYLKENHSNPVYQTETCLTLLFTDFYKLERIIKNIKLDYYDVRQEMVINMEINKDMIPSLGLHNQIRKRFDTFLTMLPRSLLIYLIYFKFESIYLKKFSNKIMYLYYQSIQSLPFSKVLYLEAVKYLPEKLFEVSNILETKELRLRIPIQELDILLEPLKSKFEQHEEMDQEEIKLETDIKDEPRSDESPQESEDDEESSKNSSQSE